MTFDVMLFKQANNAYVARPMLWPDSEVRGATEQEALEEVRKLIRDLIGRTRFVRVEVDVSQGPTGNPWLDKAGMFSNDPTWERFLQAMTDYRRELDGPQ